MTKSTILKTVSTAVLAYALTTGVAFADDKDMADMEKCMYNKSGKSMIKADKADGGTGTGMWIWVPKGECDKINKGDWTGVSDEMKAKFDWDMMKK